MSERHFGISNDEPVDPDLRFEREILGSFRPIRLTYVAVISGERELHLCLLALETIGLTVWPWRGTMGKWDAGKQIGPHKPRTMKGIKNLNVAGAIAARVISFPPQTWVIIMVVFVFGCHLASRAAEVPSRAYSEYDRDFQKFLRTASKRVGKEVIKVERLSDRFTVPQKLSIKGTPHEIGLSLGHIGRQAEIPLPTLSITNHESNQKVIELYQRIFPQHLEVIRGVAEVYKQPVAEIDVRLFEHEFTTRLWIDVLKLDQFDPLIDSSKLSAAGDTHHCSTASYYVAGHHLVGRNFDNPSDRPHYFTTLAMAGSYRVMGHTIYNITSWVVDGINEKGLTFCVTTAYGDAESYPREPAILLGQMCQIVMQTCATVDEALALLRMVRVWFPFEVNHCLIADASGKSVIVEWNPSDYKLLVFDKQGPWELLTNTPLQDGEEALMKNCSRYRDARPLLETGIRNSKDLFETMKVMRITAGGARTLWTSMMDLNARTFEVRYLKEFERRYRFKF